MKSIVLCSVLALVLGVSVAALPLQSNFALLDKYQIKAEVVYAYLFITTISASLFLFEGYQLKRRTVS